MVATARNADLVAVDLIDQAMFSFIAGFAIKEGLEAWKGETCAVPISALTGEREVEACDCC